MSEQTQGTEFTPEEREQALEVYAKQHGKQVNQLSDEEIAEASGAGFISDVMSGAASGAALGSLADGVGAGPGAVAGGILGGVDDLLS